MRAVRLELIDEISEHWRSVYPHRLWQSVKRNFGQQAPRLRTRNNRFDQIAAP
jgi:hypothetical protein